MATETNVEIRLNTVGTPEAVQALRGVRMAMAELHRASGVVVETMSQPVDAQQMDLFGAQVADVTQEVTDLGGAAKDVAQGVEELGAAAKAGGDDLEKMVPPSVEKKLKQVQFGMKEVIETSERMSGSLSTRVSAPLAAVAGIAIKTAVDLEQAAAGVRKTTDLTGDALDQLVADFKAMSERPGRPAATELLEIAEAAGQLGVQKANLKGFTETVSALRVSTNLAGEAGTQDLARLGNVMQTSQKDFGRLGSAIVALGNDGASTEAEILAMALQIAGAGKQVGLTEGSVLGFANALSSVGIGAEAGGTAISRVMMEIDKSVATGGKRLESFAQVAGMSAAQFRRAYQEDAAGAVITFIEGLRRLSDEGVNVFQVLGEVEFQDIRVQKALLAAAGAGDLFRKSIATGNEAWRENVALTKEAEGFYNTTGGELLSVQHIISNVASELGEALTPAVRDAAGAVRALLIPVREAVEVFDSLPAGVRETTAGLGLLVVAGPPAIWFFSSLATNVVTASEALAKYRAARAAATAAEVGAATAAIGTGTALISLGGLLLQGGAVIGGLFLLAKAFHDVESRARDADEEATAAVAKVKDALPQMEYGSVKASGAAAASRERDLYAEAIKKYEVLKRLIDQNADEDGAPGHAVYLQRKREYEELLALYNGARAVADAYRSEISDRNSIGGLTITAPSSTPPFGGTPSVAGANFSALGRDGDTFRALYDRLDRAKDQVKDLRIELALGGEQLKQLEPGSDAFKAMSDRVQELAANLKAAVLEVRTLDVAVTQIGTATTADLAAKMGNVVPTLAPMMLSAAPLAKAVKDPSAIYTARDRELVEVARRGRVDPSSLPTDLADDLRHALQNLGISEKQWLDEIKKGSNDLDQAGQIAVASLGAMAQAAISGTQQMESVVIQGFANIAAAAVSQANPVLGTAITVVGGLLGSLFGRRSQSQPMPVSVEQYGSRALQQQKKDGPDVIRVLLVDSSTGEQTDLMRYELGRAERRDAIVRIPRKAGL